MRMISEGSCDTEDWSNDAENTALITGINYILKYIKMEEKDTHWQHATIKKFYFEKVLFWIWYSL